MTYIEEYLEKIKTGEIIACNNIKKQVEKLADDIHNPKTFEIMQRDGTYKKVTFIFDYKKANKPIKFIEQFCKQSKSPYCGQPLKLLLWQKAVIQAMYGFVNKDTGYRRYQEVLLEIARKAGKSTLMSALADYHMICEKGFEIVVGANARHQAEIIFTEARNMLAQNPIFDDLVKKRKYDLYHPTAYNVMKPISNKGNLDGLNTDIFFADEIAEYTSTLMYNRVKGGQGVKNEPLIFLTSSGGFERDGFFDDKVDYAKKVLNGLIDDYSFLSFLYELDDITDDKKVEEQINDKQCWQKVNPSLGEHRSYTEMAKLVLQAKNDKSQKPEVYAKYFNLSQSGVSGWLAFEELENSETFDINDFKGSYFLGGYDLSEVGDLTCATFFFMKKNDTKKYIHQMYFMPAKLVKKKEQEDKVPYSKWIEQGWITTTDGFRVDTAKVFDWFVKMINKYDLYPQQQGYDRYGANEFIKKMTDAGVELEQIIQGAKTFSAPMKELKAEFQEKNIVYNNNPVLKWCLMNTKIETDSNANIRPVKGKNKKKRIDGMVSLLDAYVVYCNHKADFENLL